MTVYKALVYKTLFYKTLNGKLWPLILCVALGTAACDFFTDAATRIAYDIEAGAKRLGRQPGDRYIIEHQTPSKSGECEGPYKVQLDQVGALVVWCYDAAGNTLASPGTSYHRRFVDTQQTWILDKPAGSTLTIELERIEGRAVIVDAD